MVKSVGHLLLTMQNKDISDSIAPVSCDTTSRPRRNGVKDNDGHGM